MKNILFILLLIIPIVSFSQIILSGRGYIHPLKDSIKMYEKKQNSNCYIGPYFLYLSKKDSIKIIKYGISDQNTPRKMVEIENNIKNADIWASLSLQRSNSFCVFYDDVKITKVYDTITKNAIIEILQDDKKSNMYSLSKSKNKYEPKDLSKYSYNTTSFDEIVMKLKEDLKNEYDIITDNLTISRIIGKFYDVEKYYSLIKNNIPLSFDIVYITENSIGDPEVNIEVRNISKKDIDAFDVSISCYDRYGKPVGRYHNGSNIKIGSSNSVILSGDSDVATWTLYGQELTSKVNVVLNKVHFRSGSTFIINNKILTKKNGELK